MGFVRWLHWATSYGHIGQWVTTGPSYLAGNCHRSEDIVPATGLIILTVCLFVGDRLC
jgi:hypothetical protein